MLNLVVHIVTTGHYRVKPNVIQIKKAVKLKAKRGVTVSISSVSYRQ